MKRRPFLIVCLLLATTLAGFAVAQRFRRGRYRRPDDASDPSVRGGVPSWDLDQQFPHDAFTFARVEYSSERRRRRRGGGWWGVDWPDSDLNFSYRLQQLTSLNVHPDGRIVRLTDDELYDYPFIYIIEPGNMLLTKAEVDGLRRYLLSGGFLLVDDFWGEDEWYQFYSQIKRVFPEREPEELPLEHEIFHTVYDLAEKPQIPSIYTALSGYRTERWDAQEPHFRAIFDDRGRMMAIICHNTDLGDGWEEEGEDPWYFNEFSEKLAYPMGINIVVYAMTH